MPLSPQQIAEIKRRALAKGISEREVDLAMPQLVKDFDAKMQGSTIDTSQAKAPTPATEVSVLPPKDEGNIITRTVKGLTQNAVDYGKFVGESVAQATRAGSEALDRATGGSSTSIFGADDINKEVGQLALQDRQILAQMKTETDPEKKKALAVQSREINAKIDALGNQARDIGSKQTTFLMDEQKIKDVPDIAMTGAKATAGAMSYAVPVAKGVKAALALGGAAGALSGFGSSDGKDLQGTVQDTITGAAVGGATGAAFSLAGKVISKVIKLSTKPTPKEASMIGKIGQSLREDATQIKVSPSVYGAKKEKLIQETLDILGIKGGPVEKYEQLEPAMKAISDKIDEILVQNPNDEILAIDLVKSFKGKLSSEVRTKTLTSKVADQEIKGYLTDLVRASSNNADEAVSTSTTLVNSSSLEKQNMLDFVSGDKKATVKLDMLVKLKKLANQDYGTIADKLERGTPLTDREKVAFYARQTLDEAITRLQPKIKDLTIMQSHLYDAARPLAAARNTTPTFRIAGFTVPKEKVIEDWIGRGLISLDKKSKDLLNTWVDPVSRTIKEGYESLKADDLKLLTEAISKISIISSTNKMTNGSENEQANIDQTNYSGNEQDNTNNDLQSTTQATSPIDINNEVIISQGSKHPIPKFREFSTKDEMVADAFSKGLGTKDVLELVKLWDTFAPQQTETTLNPVVKSLIEQRSVLSKAGLSTKTIDSKLSQYGFEPNASQSLSATTENRVQLATSGIRALNDIEKMIKDDPGKVFKNVIPGKLGARDYDSAAFRAVEGLLRARSGAAIPEIEVRRYMNANLPKVGDSQEEIAYKLESFRKDLEDVAMSGGSFNAQDVLGM